MAETITRTLKLHIFPTSDEQQLLRDMTEQYRQACNFVSQYVFDHGFVLNSYQLQKILYADVRVQFGLKAQMAVSVFRTVTARYKTVLEQLRQHPYRYQEDGVTHTFQKDLDWLWRPVQFHRPQVDLVRSRDYCFLQKEHKLSLNTLGNRIKVDYADNCWPEYFDGTWTFGTGKIVSLNGNWYFHIPVSKEADKPLERDEIQHVVGIDRGLRFLTTTYDEKGKCAFTSGKEVLRKRQKFLARRKELQSKHTWSSYRKLKELSGRENRWMSDVNHQIAKTLVDTYGPNTLFVIEDLTNVSFDDKNLQRGAKQNNEIRSWAFYQLEQFLTYKAEDNHCKVLKVSAKYTSQRCPKCGCVHKANRDHANHRYVCDKCGYQSNDDRVGAMNIQNLGTLWVSGNEHPRYGIQKETTTAVG